mmetsp:Transcript_9145/g.13649  ORF Transcript_9145/g.13649 Transcript_9145/m.13649 type:complete len:94 (-) Transcript_9145:197-478(-)
MWNDAGVSGSKAAEATPPPYVLQCTGTEELLTTKDSKGNCTECLLIIYTHNGINDSLQQFISVALYYVMRRHLHQSNRMINSFDIMGVVIAHP